MVEIAQWYWQDDGGETAYNLSQNQQIEKAFIENKKDFKLSMKKHINDMDQMYAFDFQQMVQINESTGYKRTISRKLIKQQVEIISEDDFSDLGKENFLELVDFKIWLRGRQEDINKAKAEINKRLTNIRTERLNDCTLKEFDRNTLISSGLKFINDCKMVKFGVEIKEENSGLVLSGLDFGAIKSIKEERVVNIADKENSS
jgi:hypothetical protein